MTLKHEHELKRKWQENKQKLLDEINEQIKNELDKEKLLKLCSAKGFILIERPPESFLHSGDV